MTLSKETLEAASPAAKTGPAAVAALKASAAAADLNRLRADAVSLDVPVRVHGSRVTEVVRGTTPHTEPFEEETSTMIVFPQGGVVRMVTAVNVGQMLVLTNQRTNQDAICRVVKVRAYSNTQAYVEIEFTHRQLGYWGVHFPADEEESNATAAPAAAQPAVEPAEKKRVDPPVAPSVSIRVEPLPKPAPQPARQESSFAQIGSQEEVQLAATSMEARPRVGGNIPPPAPAMHSSAPHAAPQLRIAVPPRETLPSESLEIAEEPEFETRRSLRSFGTFTGGATASAERESDFEARGDSAATSAASSAQQQTAAPRNANWMWAAACAFFLVAGLAGGALYFRQHPAGAASTAQGANTSAQPVEQAASTSSASSVQTNPAATVAPASAPASENVAAERPGRSPVQSSVQSPVQEIAESQPRGANSVTTREIRPTPASGFAASAARPVVKRGGARVDNTAAPSVVAAPSASAVSLPDVLGGSNALAPPPPLLTRVHVGGLTVEPRLLRSVAPVYPSAARQAGISGNVVITAQVDKAGNVTSMKVVSGPPNLQAAALTALKGWKYQPGTLDGTPIDTQVTVTIKFQQQ
jgi:TonB family protein